MIWSQNSSKVSKIQIPIPNTNVEAPDHTDPKVRFRTLINHIPVTKLKGNDKYGKDQAQDHALPKAKIAGVWRVSYKVSYQFLLKICVWAKFAIR